MNNDIDIESKLEQIQSNFGTALHEFVRQAGYIEGTLDTMISINMELNPEISMTADRLVKTFRTIEGICAQGLKAEFIRLLDLCKDLQAQSKANEVDIVEDPLENLDSAINALNSRSKDNKKHGK